MLPLLYRVNVTSRRFYIHLGFYAFGRTAKAFYSVDKEEEAERVYGKEVPELGLRVDKSASKVDYFICIPKACTRH